MAAAIPQFEPAEAPGIPGPDLDGPGWRAGFKTARACGSPSSPAEAPETSSTVSCGRACPRNQWSASPPWCPRLEARTEAAGLSNIKVLLAHPGLAAINLQVTTAGTGGMSLGTGFMSQAQSAEDGALGILRACADPEAVSGHFFGPERWAGFPNRIPPEELLLDPENRRINWEGCEAAVGPFVI